MTLGRYRSVGGRRLCRSRAA